jgi:hypothetical protein
LPKHGDYAFDLGQILALEYRFLRCKSRVKYGKYIFHGHYALPKINNDRQMNECSHAQHQKFHHDQNNNKDGQNVNKTACVRHTRKDGLTEEAQQQLRGQHQGDEFKHGNLLSGDP